MIEVKRDGDSMLFSIRDNGRGVPAEFKQNLFELLNTTKQSGMGLGLWLCKHIVTRYNGLIWHEDASGGGATFYFKIPLAT
jgi:signal transduction histidine kinase